MMFCIILPEEFNVEITQFDVIMFLSLFEMPFDFQEQHVEEVSRWHLLKINRINRDILEQRDIRFGRTDKIGYIFFYNVTKRFHVIWQCLILNICHSQQILQTLLTPFFV